jgi:uncharacterized protein (DUF2235 family)
VGSNHNTTKETRKRILSSTNPDFLNTDITLFLDQTCPFNRHSLTFVTKSKSGVVPGYDLRKLLQGTQPWKTSTERSGTLDQSCKKGQNISIVAPAYNPSTWETEAEGS